MGKAGYDSRRDLGRPSQGIQAGGVRAEPSRAEPSHAVRDRSENVNVTKR